MELKLDINIEYGLVLEGGGAKGAYQIGAWKALKEAGIHIKGIAGTSVGALNGALIAMDDFEKAEKIWETIRYSRVMDVDDDLMEQLKTSGLKDIAVLGLSELIPAAKKVLKDRGFDIGPLRSLIEEVVDEEKIRNSEKELYVVTYSLSDRKPMVVNVKEVPEGEIADMLMASAYLIGFRREKLAGKYYMDGGGVNNVPIDVLMEKGYKDILVFRIYGYGVDTERHLKVPDDIHLYHVAPRQDLGGLLEFDRRRARKNMVLGYFDAKRMLYGLEGRAFYLAAPESEIYYFNRLLAEAPELLADIWPELSKTELFTAQMASCRRYTEEWFPKLARALHLKDDWDYKELYLSLLEHLARQYKISRFKIYTPQELLLIIQRKRKRIFLDR